MDSTREWPEAPQGNETELASSIFALTRSYTRHVVLAQSWAKAAQGCQELSEACSKEKLDPLKANCLGSTASQW